MFKIVGILALGVIIGILFRSRIRPNVVSKIITYIIYLLLLVLGVAVGANDYVMSRLDTLGYNALIIAMGAIFGSILLTVLIYNRKYKKQIKK